MLDLVFMGTAPFAVPCLEAVIAAGHRVHAVVSQPDRPHGRGMKLQSTPVKLAAEAHSLPVLQPPKARDPEFIAQIRELRPEVIVVVAYGQILKQELLNIPPCGCINVHGSLLPELRGAAPIQWAIISGLAETGVTTMFMDAGMDTGDMVLKYATPISPSETWGELAERLSHAGAELLVRTLERVEAGNAPREPQNSALATYAPMLRREDGAIRWSEPAERIRNLIHGCNPSPGAFARRAEGTLKVWRAEVVPISSGSKKGNPGTVLDANTLVIAAGDGAVRLLEVQPENRSRLDGATFCRGYRVGAGELWEDGIIDAA